MNILCYEWIDNCKIYHGNIICKSLTIGGWKLHVADGDQLYINYINNDQRFIFSYTDNGIDIPV
jgi:hypothetical protein